MFFQRERENALVRITKSMFYCLIMITSLPITFLAQALIAVAYARGATAKAHGDAATMSPKAL